ncbi:hypothetical protein VC83_08685 [Pseudogymnoascus destructans]|uniref:Uncharacterized protein n=1 Tax=Pseudogymnoascus destructans TaxID=655981 RepID=A0A176ZY86_9PEZI|nr:uncharacterized protein VC83_08685 [Pseudogymnoascus destructans]OAF54838.1 hypothetical protein VC83_08685 [Pseudogymnoascus destructans]
MSDSELSDLPLDHESYSQIEELSLPHLPAPIQPSVEAVDVSINLPQHPRVVLPATLPKLFTKGLYRRELLDTRPPTIKMICLQPGCGYSLLPSYQCEQGAAQIPVSFDSNIEVKNTLENGSKYEKEDWIMLHALQNFFVIFVKPSQKLQASLYPMLNFAIPQYLKMIKKLEALQKEVGISSTIGLACIAAHKKLNEYYTLATNQRWSHSGVATICDPHMNLNVFNSLWPSSTEEVKRNRVKQQFHDVFIQYRDRQYYLEEEKREAEADLPQLPTEPDSDDNLYLSHSIYQEPEWKSWLVEPQPGPATDILKYWAAKQYQYPIIAAIA